VSSPLHVLLVEDSVADAALVERSLRRVDRDLVLRRVRDEWQMRSELAGTEWDLIVADLVLPSFTGLEALGVAHESGSDVPFIVLSGVIGEGAALAAMRAGADDFLLKSDLSRLPAVVERELREAVARRSHRTADLELAALREQRSRDVERRAELVGALHDLATACADRSDEESLAMAAAAQAARLLETDAGLGLRDPAAGPWLFATSGGGCWRAEPGPDGALVVAAASGFAPVVAGPCQVLPLASGGVLSAVAACAVPLPGVDGPIGGLAAWTGVPRAFGTEDIALLEVVAAVAGPALDSIGLARRAGQRSGGGPRR
jgi:CheY-like chemotaxis protein